PAGATGGPGARYLAARRRAANPGIPEVAALRRALRPLVRAERIERHEKGQLLASVHDLVVRAEAPGYRRIVEGAAGELAGRKVTVSGPWPPYAFAPGGLG
ncbi:MAG: Gas vesicle synthesis protein GvpL/GvpF, partial [Acidobacteriota bacterium]|nr:Gas vesicle synthesis protein GvpL/GvpF [Acidobacteriota bacterium]